MSGTLGTAKGKSGLSARVGASLFNLPPRLASGRQALLARFVEALPLALFRRPPDTMIVDVTNACNLRCPVCPVTVAMTRPRGFLPLDRFKAVIDDLGRHGWKPAMFFNFSGEPTMNPALPEMVAYATAHGHESFLSTNVTFLTDELSEKLIRAGLGRVALCLDGFSKQAHESYRVRSDFERTKANIVGFVEAKRRLGATKPVTVLQTLLTSLSEDDQDEIRAWAKSIGIDKVRFKSFSLGSHTDDETRSRWAWMVPKRVELRRHQEGTVRQLCNTPLHQSVVFWNGQLGLCCIDYDKMVSLPNVDVDGYVAAYRSDAAARARRSGVAKRFKICRSCSYSNAESMGFLVRMGRESVTGRTAATR